MARKGAGDRELITANLQLIIVLVYRSSPPESHEQGYLHF